jgi:hypothetical protein
MKSPSRFGISACFTGKATPARETALSNDALQKKFRDRGTLISDARSGPDVAVPASDRERQAWGVREGNRVQLMKQSGKDGEAMTDKAGATGTLGSNSEIGRKLKQYYDGLVSDDVPDRFSQLLSQLEKAERTEKKD